jgi:hypothetical protein
LAGGGYDHFRGYRFAAQLRRIQGMRYSRLIIRLPLILVATGTFAANASISTVWRTPASRTGLQVVRTGERSQMSESLREDVARHPNDFVVFETLTAAGRFMEEHKIEINRETDPRMIQSGILGYWQGKTVVVLPVVLSLGTDRGL